MRVISGKYKGRRLNSPINNAVRPTTDKVKEALFGILQSEIEGAVFVDLFAGSGGVGIEALSRGAKKVYFCDNNSKSLDLLMSNLAFCDNKSYEVFKGDYADCLRLLNSRKEKCDVIFCDPPYAKKLGNEILGKLQKYDILSKNGSIIIERNTDEGEINNSFFERESTRSYGYISIDIFKIMSKIAITGTFDPFTIGHRDLVEKALEDFDRVYIAVLNNPEKQMTYSLEQRLKMIKLSLLEFKKRIKIEYFDGLAVDFCAKNGIKYILRGTRNDRDFEYERKMAEYNKINGGIETLFMPAKHQGISSTKVRENVKIGQSVDDLVSEEILSVLADKN